MRTRTLLAAAGVGAAYTEAKFLDRTRRQHSRSCDAPNLTAAVEALDATGVVIVRSAVDAEMIAACRGTDSCANMPAAASASATRDWRISAFGRYHRINFEESDVAAFEAVERRFWPLVTAFFKADGGSTHDIYRSELQLLTATPESKNQMWHSDNRRRGLTVIVPLVDFTLENGATQLLAGSHDASWRCVVNDGATVLQAPTGSIAAYDARTYHRGLGNSTEESRPALVFRYDRASSPPPGCGVAGSLAHAARATALHLTAEAWQQVWDRVSPAVR